MRKATADLLEIIKESPASFFISRNEANYDLFLDLYRRVGYGPTDPDALAAWQDRSRRTWKLQDAIFPGNCTGGFDGGQCISSWGTLPMADNLIYGHSVCMTKNLPAAATLFAQSLHSLTLSERFPESPYWVGSYSHLSNFTPLFQRPARGQIADQIEFEVIRLLQPLNTLTSNNSPVVFSENLTQDHLSAIDESHREFFTMLSRPHSLFRDFHVIKKLAILGAFSEKLLCVALVQDVPPEFTAANVFSWTWIFPATDVAVDRRLVGALRSTAELRLSSLQIVLQDKSALQSGDFVEPVIPSFWALTPKSQLTTLRKSFETAFATLLDRYPDEDLMSLHQRDED